MTRGLTRGERYKEQVNVSRPKWGMTEVLFGLERGFRKLRVSVIPRQT